MTMYTGHYFFRRHSVYWLYPFRGCIIASFSLHERFGSLLRHFLVSQRSVTAARICGLTTNYFLSHHHRIQLMRFTGFTAGERRISTGYHCSFEICITTPCLKIRANFII